MAEQLASGGAAGVEIGAKRRIERRELGELFGGAVRAAGKGPQFRLEPDGLAIAGRAG
jgi:hypothetical protein